MHFKPQKIQIREQCYHSEGNEKGYELWI